MCSVAEAVLLSITPAYIQKQRRKAPQWGERLKQLRQDRIDRSLAAILTMNTIAHTVGAIEAGVQAATVFGSSWVGLFSGVMTLAILFFSEIIPKTLGAVHWPRLVKITTLYIRGLIILLYPLVVASERVTRLITRGKSMPHFSREEIIALASVGEQTGGIDRHESRIIHNLFLLRSLTVADIMTPRTVLTALPDGKTISEAQAAVQDSPFSRLPIYSEDIDTIHSFVLKDEILAADPREQGDVPLENLKREIHAVPEYMRLPGLLNSLLEERHHIALVVDEFGGTKGVVTLEDVLETLLGIEIMDELDDVADMQAVARQQWARRMRGQKTEPPDES